MRGLCQDLLYTPTLPLQDILVILNVFCLYSDNFVDPCESRINDYFYKYLISITLR